MILTSRNSGLVPHEAYRTNNLPRTKKLLINIQGEQEGPLTVWLGIPLSEEYPAEVEAKKYFVPEGDSDIYIEYTVNINIAAEMKAFSNTLKKLFRSSVGQKMGQDSLSKMSSMELGGLLEPIIEQGRHVFHLLFENRGMKIRNYSGDSERIVRAAIKSALTHSQIISIKSPVPLFPWAFLYSDENYVSANRSTIDPLSFWGFKHQIQEQLDCTSPFIHLPTNPKIITAICPFVDKVGWHRDAEHPFKQISCEIIPAPSAIDLGNALKSFEGDCLYFFGHASHPEEDPVASESWLKMLDVKLTVAQLMQDYYPAPKFNSDLVVAFLNGCRTAPLRVWSENTVIGFLCMHGDNRLCCIASVAEVPAVFAAAFARKFWQQFLIEKHTIGHALLDARLQLFHEWNNPFGLLYSLFGRVDTYVGC
jgi:hypothetical protein